jgi:hypothetical protein
MRTGLRKGLLERRLPHIFNKGQPLQPLMDCVLDEHEDHCDETGY